MGELPCYFYLMAELLFHREFKRYKIMKAPFKVLVSIFFIFIAANLCIAQTDDSETLTLEQQLIKEQINNQKAQSIYYQKQIADKSFWDSAAPGITAAIGTLFGALLTFGAVNRASKRQWDLEHEKWLQSEKEQMFADKKIAAAELARKVAAQVNEIIWLTWKAKYHPEILTNEDIDLYDKEVKILQKEEIVAQAALATLSLDLHTKVRETIHMVSLFDFDMSFVTSEFKKTKGSQYRKEMAAKIGEYYFDAYALYDNLPHMLGTLLQTESEIKDREQTALDKFVFTPKAERLLGKQVELPSRRETPNHS
jgi:hypothetical protein